jgi:hypothetical protein
MNRGQISALTSPIMAAPTKAACQFVTSTPGIRAAKSCSEAAVTTQTTNTRKIVRLRGKAVMRRSSMDLRLPGLVDVRLVTWNIAPSRLLAQVLEGPVSEGSAGIFRARSRIATHGDLLILSASASVGLIQSNRHW